MAILKSLKSSRVMVMMMNSDRDKDQGGEIIIKSVIMDKAVLEEALARSWQVLKFVSIFLSADEPERIKSIKRFNAIKMYGRLPDDLDYDDPALLTPIHIKEIIDIIDQTEDGMKAIGHR